MKGTQLVSGSEVQDKEKVHGNWAIPPPPFAAPCQVFSHTAHLEVKQPPTCGRWTGALHCAACACLHSICL